MVDKIVDPADKYRTAAVEPEAPVAHGVEDSALAAKAAELEALIAETEAAPVVQEIIEEEIITEEPAVFVPPEVVAPVASAPTHLPTRQDRPVPDDQLTPDQLRIRDLEHRLALAQARKLDSDTATVFEERGQGELIEFYVTQDGWTGWGEVWYRGQEFAIEVGSLAYQDTFNRYGETWLRFLEDDSAQVTAYGDIMLRKGRWPGKPYENPLAAAREAKRNRAAPVVRM